MTTEQPVPILDDPAKMQAVDRRNMLRLISELPEQCETALGIGRSVAVDPLSTNPNVVYITGVGDSAIAGDMAAAAVGDDVKVPVVSDHGSRLPEYVGEEALVFVVDYAGKSQSSLRNYREARLRGANVICITSGGKLFEAASKDGAKMVKIPPGQPPRSAIGYLLVPLVAAMERLGLVTGNTEQLSYAIKLMKNAREMFRFENFTLRNVAKQTALALQGKLPVIYGAPGYRMAVANRWKSQINANSKAPAFAGAFPDITEAEISGWEMAGKEVSDLVFIFLKDAVDKTTEIASLMSASKELLGRHGVIEIDMKGATTAEKLLYGTYLGDFVSCYLALLYEVDPSATENIAFVESLLTS